MRVATLIVTSAVIGTAVGAILAYVEARPSASVLPSRPVPAIGLTPADSGSAPRVEVDSLLHEFGTMQRGTSMSHEFVFRNVGGRPLTLSVGSTSCKCTVGNVADELVPPGGSVKVKLEWRALAEPGPFRQTATILTNDPLRSRVDLSIEGTVTEASGISPPDFLFDKVTAGKEKSAHVFVMALVQDDLEVADPTFSNDETRKFFDVRVEPVDRASLPNPDAKQGVRITVTAKPGLPIGHIDQYLTITTNIPAATQIDIPILGRVVGNISVHGHFWSKGRGALMLGNVKSDAGAVATLTLVIRGDGAADVAIDVASTDPPELLAKLGEPKQLRPTLVHLPLTVEIPPGTPPMVRLDTDQSDAARIVLKTTLPDAPEMVLRAEFTVER